MRESMVVLSGSNARLLATQLAESLGLGHHSLETRRFPDSEGYIRIPEEVIEAVRKEPVVLVSNTFPDSGIVETLLMLEAINDVRRGNLRKFARNWTSTNGRCRPREPCLPYHISDILDKTRRFKPGEAISARAIGHLLASQM